MAAQMSQMDLLKLQIAWRERRGRTATRLWQCAADRDQSGIGKFVIMGDADDSYDFKSLEAFVEKLQAGYDLVFGNRFQGGIKDGAMPWLHRYFGNPLLTAIGRLLYKSPVNDFYCGLRGFRREAILQLELSAPGMELALEMIVKSTIRRSIPARSFQRRCIRPAGDGHRIFGAGATVGAASASIFC